MRIVIVGKDILAESFQQKGCLVWDDDAFKPEIDLRRLDEFDVVVNCINRRIGDFEETFYANSLVARALSNYCDIKNKKFVQMSTGCAYDQLDQDNKETDLMAFRSNYALTKLTAEQFCHKNDLILRPALLFGNRNQLNSKQNFVSSRVIVEAALSLIYSGQNGVFNVACEGKVTLQEIAARIDISSWVKQELYSIISLDKLKNFYKPPQIMEELEHYGKI